MEHIFLLFGTRQCYLNQYDKRVKSKVIQKVMDYITNYNFCHVIWNQ